MRRIVQRLVFVFVGLCPSALYAQASLTGTVKDPRGPSCRVSRLKRPAPR